MPSLPRYFALGTEQPNPATELLNELDAASEALYLQPSYIGFSSPAQVKSAILSAATREPASEGKLINGLPPTSLEFAVRLANLGDLSTDGVTLFFTDYSTTSFLTVDTEDTWQHIGNRQIMMAFIPAGWVASFGACVGFDYTCPSPGVWGTGWVGGNQPRWVMLYLPFRNQKVAPGLDNKGRPVVYQYVRTQDRRTAEQKRIVREATTAHEFDVTKELIKRQAESAEEIAGKEAVIKDGLLNLDEKMRLENELEAQRQAKYQADLQIAQEQEMARMRRETTGFGKNNTMLYIGLAAAAAIGAGILLARS